MKFIRARTRKYRIKGMKYTKENFVATSTAEQRPVVKEFMIAPEDGIIETLEGEMKVNKGDYIMRGIEGEVYCVKKEIFLKTYSLDN